MKDFEIGHINMKWQHAPSEVPGHITSFVPLMTGEFEIKFKLTRAGLLILERLAGHRRSKSLRFARLRRNMRRLG